VATDSSRRRLFEYQTPAATAASKTTASTGAISLRVSKMVLLPDQSAVKASIVSEGDDDLS
jgi:hypothetical protein